MARKTPFLIEKERVVVDCYRFKIEINSEGQIRIYAYNTSKKGDVCILFEPNKIKLNWEYGKEKEVLKERLREIVFEKVFEEKRLKR